MTRSEAAERFFSLGLEQSELLNKFPELLMFFVRFQPTSQEPVAKPSLLSAPGNASISFNIAAGSTEWPIFEHAVRVFGETAEATGWLIDRCPVLNARPIELLGTTEGRQQVDDVLNCIEHGMIY